MKKKVFTGHEKNAPIVVNKKGGMQSYTAYAFHTIDPIAMQEMAKVMAEGCRKYAQDNWRLISVEEHLNHLLMHIFAHLAGDTQDDHLAHAMTRAMFALAVDKRPKYLGAMAKKGKK
jgi:hypothetical protein